MMSIKGFIFSLFAILSIVSCSQKFTPLKQEIIIDFAKRISNDPSEIFVILDYWNTGYELLIKPPLPFNDLGGVLENLEKSSPFFNKVEKELGYNPYNPSLLLDERK